MYRIGTRAFIKLGRGFRWDTSRVYLLWILDHHNNCCDNDSEFVTMIQFFRFSCLKVVKVSLQTLGITRLAESWSKDQVCLIMPN